MNARAARSSRTSPGSKFTNPVSLSLWLSSRRISDKLHLLWLKQTSSLHTKLSFNILREVCEYLGYQSQQPIALLDDEFGLFDLTVYAWRRVPLRPKIKVKSGFSVTYIAYIEVFVCGGSLEGANSGIRYIGKTAFVVGLDSAVRPCPNMKIGRGCPGVFYDSNASAVYVFGGWIWAGGKNAETSACEQFLLSSCQWKPMSRMKRPRACFNPCSHSSLVYICGGGSAEVEVYTPQTDEFSVLPDFILPMFKGDIACTTVVRTGELVVITENLLCKWSLELRQMTVRRKHTYCYPWSQCTPIESEGVLYVVNGTGTDGLRCTGIDLNTGETEKQVRYRS